MEEYRKNLEDLNKGIKNVVFETISTMIIISLFGVYLIKANIMHSD